MTMLVLGLDFGIKKMGVALGNSLSQDARPLTILAMDNGKPDWDNLLGIIATWQVKAVAVGLPLNADGSPSLLSVRAHKFARRLAHQIRARKLGVGVYLVNEHLSSWHARTQSAHAHIDDIAACAIVESFFCQNPNPI